MTKKTVLSDIEIARAAKIKRIGEIAAKLNIPEEDLDQYGHYKAKVSLDYFHSLAGAPAGKLILVTAISPTPAGEGKTTTTVGLGDALNRIGKRAIICLREPSLGPCFGVKGGAAGGGYAQVIPMEDINLHFTGDFHAIGTAHNLLAAMLDNHLKQGNALNIDVNRVVWRRVVDMNDRALRSVTLGLGGFANGIPRESGYDITVASEVMAIFCLSESLKELRERLGKIVVAYTRDKKPVTAADLKAHGAMTVLLKDALKPNLVQTLENNPAFVHGGPFANIAHGCNSVLATKLSMRLGDYTVTEAGFGADLGAEKFLNIKCRKAGIQPGAIVLVATVRALKMHGGVAKADLGKPDPAAVEKGIVNLEKHLENIRLFNVPAVVAINHFTSDTDEEVAVIENRCKALGVQAIKADHWARGGAGAENLARAVVELAERPRSNEFQFLYTDEMSLWNKVRAIAQNIYGADNIMADVKVRQKFKDIEAAGHGNLPVCMAKTQYSLSTDPALLGRPKNFDVPIRDVKLSAGAGFVVVLLGDIMTMPGLPKVPAAEVIDLNEAGEIVGLF
ncbi:MAG: formate--tetrahydrofolate ligase [Verrucomicrobia bacterium]|nr:formate--tetrahydrofolate ligase [Verrucomicrobiota bacterium]